MKSTRSFQLLLLVFSLAVAWRSAVGQVVIATVPAGIYATEVALNSVTNKMYVTNQCGNDSSCLSPGTVTVIDGATNNTTTVTVGYSPYAVAVNSVTNKIYVTNLCGNDVNCSSAGTVTVIDGVTNNTTSVTVGNTPYSGLAVNSVTNKIYVANFMSDTVTVIDGATNNTTTVTVGNYPSGVAVNAVTNKIYVVNNCGSSCLSLGTVTVIDGVTNNTTTVTVGYSPYAVAVNSVTNKIYVANSSCRHHPCNAPGTVTVIDGPTNNTMTVGVGDSPFDVEVNSVTNKIYVPNYCGNDLNCKSSGTVTVIDGATNNTTTVNVGAFPYGVAVSAVTNKIYAANGCGNDLTCKSAGTVTVIDGATNNTLPIAVGDDPTYLAVDATTDRVYAANFSDGTVSVIAGDTALQFVAVTPCRVYDTRPQHGGNGPILGGTFQTFNLPQLAQSRGCASLSSAATYSLNVTLIPDQNTTVGYLTIWPASQNLPVVSLMNSLDGRIKANAAIVPAGVSGAVSVYVTNTADVALDINGYFVPTSSSTLAFYSLTPCRVIDTRKSNFPPGLGPPQLAAGKQRDFPVLNSSCIPSNVNAAAYSFNFTVVPGGHPVGYLSVWPTGQTQPVVSTLNDPTGTIEANAAIASAGTGGEISVYSTDNTQLLVDVNGYFAPAGPGGLSLYPSVPCRVLDTRKGKGAFSGELTVDVLNSTCAPPSQGQAYVFNATVVPQGSLGYLALWPDGQQQPVVSTLNATDAAITSNMAIVPAGAQGKVEAYAGNGLTQLILDISSYFAP